MWHAPSQINTVHELLLSDIFLNCNWISFNRADKMICVTKHTLVSYFETWLVLLLISLLLLNIHLNIFQVVHIFHSFTDLLRLDSLLLLSSIKVKILNIAVPQTFLMCAFFVKWQVRRLNSLLMILFLLLACAYLPFLVKFHFLEILLFKFQLLSFLVSHLNGSELIVCVIDTLVSIYLLSVLCIWTQTSVRLVACMALPHCSSSIFRLLCWS